MKKLLLAALLATGWAGTANAQILYDDFETTPGGTRLVAYARQSGAMIQNQMNPGSNAVNGSPTCCRYTRNGGVQYDNFDIETPRTMADVTPYVGSGSTAGITKFIRMDFYSPAPGTQVLLVLQNKAKNRSGGYPAGKLLGEFTATTTATNAWETLTFAFNYVGGGNFDPTVTATTVDEITMLIAPNTFTGTVTHFDNVYGPELAAAAPPSTATAGLYEDFEGSRRLRYLSVDGTLTPGFANPAAGAANPSAVVGRYVRNGSLPYATLALAPANGTFLDDVTAFASTSATQNFTVKMYSPAAGTAVQVVLGNAAKRLAGGNNYPTGTHSLYLGTTSVANAWETVTLTYQAGSYDAAVRPTEIDRMDFQIAPGQNNGGTYLFDDFKGAPTTLPVARLYENFNDTRVLTYGVADGVLTQNAANPSQGGSNPNPRVGRYVRSAAQQYDTFYAQLPAPMDDATEFQNNIRHFSMRVYCPEPVGTLVTVTFTDAAATPTNYPTGRPSVYSANTTVQNGWQTLTFNYLFSPTGGNNVRSITGLGIQFDGGNNTGGTWYFDQVYGPSYTAAPGALYEDFETGRELTTTFSDGTLTQAAASPAVFGENYSPNTGHYVRSGNQYDVIGLVPTGGRRLTNVSAYASTSATKYFYLKQFSKTPGTPVQLTIQNAAKATTGYPNGIHSIYTATTTKSNEWELLRFAYQVSGPGAYDPTVSVNQVNQLILLFNPGANGAGGQVYDYDFIVGQDLLSATGLTWNGSISSDWNDGDNWSGNVAPVAVSGAPAIIPGGLTRYPVLTAGNVYGSPDIIINAGGSLTQTGGTLNLANGVTNNGTYTQTGGLTDLVGTGSHVFGNGAPMLFYDLTVGAGNMVLAGGPQGTVSVKHVLRLNGNITTNDHLILLSDITGTALVVNSGGVATGNTTVQRYLSPALNNTIGYRHFSACVTGATVADIRGANTPAPTVNTAYNTSLTPGNVNTYVGSNRAFPTVFTYNEQRLAATTATTADFNYGWQSPADGTDALVAGLGYTVHIVPTTVQLTGVLRTGPQAITLSRGSLANSGWAMLGNPYPAPINWNNLVRPAGIDNALYTFRSDSRYGGSYVAYVNGVGPAGANLVASSQGFFVRANAATTLTFTDAARETSYVSPVQYRAAADPRPVLALRLQDAAGANDDFYVYQEAGATAAFDTRYDALRMTLNSGTAPTLFQQANGQDFSIQGLPAGTQPVALALGLNAPAAGRYTLAAAQLANFPASAALYLEDQQNGTWHNLRSGSYAATLAAGTTAGRFVLHLYQQRPLATAGSQLVAAAVAYPNPAPAGTVVQLTAGLKTGDIVDLAGRVAGHFVEGKVPTTGLKPGLYLLRETPTGRLAKLMVQ